MRNINDYYKIDKNNILGQGQYGEVYVCQKLENDYDYQKYCVKIIPLLSQDIQDEEMISEILKNYNSSNFQTGPKCINIVQTFDIFKDEISLYIVMEQCDEDLYSEFERMKSFNVWYSEQEVFELIRQIISSMKFLYNQKIIHRDIKPENILIKKDTQNKIYKLGDFGVGKLIEDMLNKSVITKTGSLNYAAPQMIFNQDCKSKCDIFSYGVLFYNICYKGEFPYPCNSIQNLLKSLKQLKSKRFKAPDLDFHRGGILKDLLEKMIVYDEAERTSYDEIFQHQIMTQTGMEETVNFLFQSEQLCQDFDKKESQDKKLNEILMLDLQINKTLLEVLFNRFKICYCFFKEIESNSQLTFLCYIIQLIAKYQLDYALAFVYIRPLELHPRIKQYNDIPELVQKQRQLKQFLLDYKGELAQEVLSLRQEIQVAFHKLRTDLFHQENKMKQSTQELSWQELDIIKNSATSRIEISILQDQLRNMGNQSILQDQFSNIQNLQSEKKDISLKEHLNLIINLETKFSIDLYKDNTDLNEKFPIHILQQYNKYFV